MKDFEQKIIAELLEESELKDLPLFESVNDELVEFGGAGYFLTFKNANLPMHRLVLNRPDIRGKLGGIDVGYLAFVENSEFMLECYSYDHEVMPEHRDQDFVRTAT